MGISSRTISQILLFVVIASISVFIVDHVVLSGEILSNNELDFADKNDSVLSVLISGFLLIAYLMQYLVQDSQHELMSRQESIMNAGYTPILGVTSSEWGNERNDNIDLEPHEANKYYMNIMNSGNSTARDLRLKTEIGSCAEPADITFYSHSVPLQRTSEGTWWPTDVGGALSESHNEPTEFYASPKVRKIEKTGLLKRDKEIREVHIHTALQAIEKSDNNSATGTNEVKITIYVKYKTATGSKQEIKICELKEMVSNLGVNDYHLYKYQSS
ncbi:hypothetical protein [Natrinema versiforme]|uniref:hypothetical protein n=1 Tax=Natrinema versiforme TaxID=88724 RepID=UPI001268A131|nr:hypothetical protein [Natrinema versiforme]